MVEETSSPHEIDKRKSHSEPGQEVLKVVYNIIVLQNATLSCIIWQNVTYKFFYLMYTEYLLHFYNLGITRSLFWRKYKSKTKRESYRM